MAVASMQAVNIIGFMDHIDEVIMVLGESGVFHPDEVSDFYVDTRDFTHLQANNIFAEPLTDLRASLSRAKLDLELCDTREYSPGVNELTAYSESVARDIDALTDNVKLCEKRLDEAKKDYITASHFKGLDKELEQALKMKYIDARFGKLPKDSLQKLSMYRDDKYVDFAVCTEGNNNVWGVYFAPKELSEQIDRIFDGLYFERVNIVYDNETPSERIEKYNTLLPELEKDVRDAKRALEDYLGANREQITLCLSKLEELYLFAGIRTKAMQYNNSFIIVGWIPTANKDEISLRLKSIRSIEMDFSDAKNEMEKRPPAKLKNCFLAKPFEFYTEMYGVPKYNEIDPSLFVAITYIIIFGIMFADLGQGIVLSIVGILMWKLKKMKIGKILFPCGISSAIFGTIFGSVFGYEHLLDSVYQMAGLDEKPIEVMHRTNEIILSAIAIGVVLLIIAMMLNVYTSFRQHNYGRALFSQSGIAGIVFYSALVFGLAGELFLGLHVMTLPYILGLIVLPFILIYFDEPLTGLVNREENWKPESWGGYIVEKLFESIEVILSYVTNTMSFLRVGAFVLVHAGMMLVVFVLAETVGGVGYTIVVIVGNGLVMALEALLVAIQVLRLEYYEMFSRFYSGEGRAFEPVKLSTKN